jgi:chaperonin GroEL
MLRHALRGTLRALLLNSGHDPSEVLPAVYRAGAGYGFDVLRRQVVDMSQAGIFDAASVVKAAVFGAIHGAALALTVDVMVHLKNPPDASATV